jgi:hypothetical protein
VWVVLLGSAAIGALVSAIVTGVGQWRERHARRRELLLVQSIELARSRTRMMIDIAEKTGRPLTLIDDVIVAANYHKLLSHLFDHGHLPPDAKLPGMSPPDGELKNL